MKPKTPQGDQPPEMTDEDEALLDKIWDALDDDDTLAAADKAESQPKIIEKDGQYCIDKDGKPGRCYETRRQAEDHMTGKDEEERPNHSIPHKTLRSVLADFKELIGGWRADLRGGRDVSVGIKIAGNDWLITYTNNFADREGEAFSAKAIDDYVTRVDMGVVDPPEWWVWHVGANTRVGQAEWVARHGHFVIAKGVFDDTPQAQAAKEYYRQHGKDTGISHGFTYPADQFDGVTYHAFNTFEISTMPRDFEANRYTSFEGVKSMKITPEKKAHLEEVFGAEQAAKILSDLDSRGKALEGVGVQYKDFVEPVPAAPEAVKQTNEDVKQLILDLIGDSAEFASLLNAGAKARATDAAALTEIQTRLKALEAIAAERPRAASTADETAVKQEDIVAEVQQQFAKRDSFWGTMVADEVAEGSE